MIMFANQLRRQTFEMFRLKRILLVGAVVLTATSGLADLQLGASAIGKTRIAGAPVTFAGSHQKPNVAGIRLLSLSSQTPSRHLSRRSVDASSGRIGGGGGSSSNSPGRASGNNKSNVNRMTLLSTPAGGSSNIGGPLASFSAAPGDTGQTAGLAGGGEYNAALGTTGEGRANPNAAAAAGASGSGGLFPAFDGSAMEEVITAVIGRPAFLPCAVTNLGDRTVSWIRRKELNVLSVGLARYTQDPRFSVIHSAGSDLWTLQLAYPTAEDSGVYECQVGTLPKISRQVTLNVIARSAKISGGPQLYVNTGSVLNLTCVVSGDGILAYVGHHSKSHTAQHQQQHQQNQLSGKTGGSLTSSRDPADSVSGGRSSVNKMKDHTNSIGGSGHGPRSNSDKGNVFHVFWYHNGAVLNYDRSARVHRYGGVGNNGGSIVSTVTIARAHENHSGNYTCRPSNAEPDTITVHVLNGDQPTLAMQGGGSSLLSSGAMSSFSLADLWRALYGVALPCMLYAACVRLR